MNSGELNQRLFFMKPGEKNENGFPDGEPTLYTKSWASLKTLKGKLFYEAASNNMQHNREFTIRFQRKLADDKRPKGLIVVWKKIDHEIVSIENDNGLNVSMTVVLKAVD